jgi:hypothetical protein
MCRVFTLLPCAVHKQLIYFVGSFLDLLFCFFGVDEDGSWLLVVIAVEASEVKLGILIALMNDANRIEQGCSLSNLNMERLQVGVDVSDVDAFN